MKCPSCGAETSGNFCAYCGSELPKDSTTVGICPKCGNSSITFKRERIETTTQRISRKNILGTGRTGQSVSRSTYRTVGFCRNCGYTWNPCVENNTGKRKTWLWVLGWICIFPIPLSILMVRKKSMKPAVRYGIIVVAWLIFLIIAMSGNSEADVPSTNVLSQTENQTTAEQLTGITSTGNTPIDDAMVFYVEDEVVNRFISEFNEQSTFEITDISKGNIRTKYFGSANGRYLEMINASDAGANAFCLTINGGQEDADKQSMYEVFRESIKVLDSSVTDDMIDDAISEFNNKDVLIEGYALGDSITIAFVPTKELSYGKSSCRIDIYASSYK